MERLRVISTLLVLLGLLATSLLTTNVQASACVVTTDADSGADSLRAKIADASCDTITFNGNYTIRLASQLTIDRNVTIDGAGYAVTISGENTVRVFNVNSNVTVALNSLTITNGFAVQGGGIYNAAGSTLTVTNSGISENSAGAPPVCGNSAIEYSEACDDGNTVSGDGCSSTCTIQPGYSCFGAPSVCLPSCGDGLIIGGEACDDGNTVSGDGCSSTCTIQPGYSCFGAPSVCLPNCGDGLIVGGEACDDGNTVSGDGCSSTCTVQPGYSCFGAPSVCLPNCGDGLIVGGEACDDGNAVSGDGCSSTCTVESGYNCVGVPSVCTNGKVSASGIGGGDYNYRNVLKAQNSALSSQLIAYGYGGGIYNDGGALTLTNVTFSGNLATLNGGGIYNLGGSSMLTNITFSGNSADYGGGMYNDTGSTMIRNTILWNNTASTDGAQVYNFNSAPVIDDSLIQGGCPAGATCNANILNVDPLLGALVDNGGYTYTMALGEGSPAKDAGNNSTCAMTDQRGIKRPQGLACDMGAYEVEVNQTVAFKSTGSQDGWILESGEKTSKGGTKDSTSTTIRLGDNAAKKQYRGILSFSTKSLPDTAVIVQVTLKVKKQGITGGGNPVTMFQGFMADIKQGYFGTSALQTTDFQTAASKTYGPFKTVISAGNWYNINLTSGKAYINKTSASSGLTQIRLRFKLDDNNNTVANYLSLYSGNAGSSYRPQLIIEYYVP
jgi:cysteine-rich repeat protein/predicted outer membrane repeat protein